MATHSLVCLTRYSLGAYCVPAVSRGSRAQAGHGPAGPAGCRGRAQARARPGSHLTCVQTRGPTWKGSKGVTTVYLSAVKSAGGWNKGVEEGGAAVHSQ